MVLGLCGGYQILGRRLSDPGGIEGPPSAAPGLGLLDVETVLAPAKVLRHVAGNGLGAPFEGYEMHMGQTTGLDCARPFAVLADGHHDGAVSADGRVLGTYIHGLLGSTDLRAALLDRLHASSSGTDYAASVDQALDGIAAALEAHVDVPGLLALAQEAR
jgi:adenosylcobyric acid synthase